ncbi:MAG: hypothetical protein MJB14_21265, partial [Spirochaetes bacterium]|nr:hypothetical protein [Spirochaetota bacterium]
KLKDKEELGELLEELLNYIEKEEAFFSTIYRELPFYPQSLRRQIFFSEGGIRGYIYPLLEAGIAKKIYKPIDSTMGMTYFFGTLQYLLVNRTSLVGQGSVIKAKKKELIDTFMTLIAIEGY